MIGSIKHTKRQIRDNFFKKKNYSLNGNSMFNVYQDSIINYSDLSKMRKKNKHKNSIPKIIKWILMMMMIIMKCYACVLNFIKSILILPCKLQNDEKVTN